MTERPSDQAYHQAIRVLLEGVCGVNIERVAKQAGVARPTLQRFLSASHGTHPDNVERLALVVWRKLNAHVLLSEEDKAPS